MFDEQSQTADIEIGNILGAKQHQRANPIHRVSGLDKGKGLGLR
jgi:hypothetical protein